MVYFNECSIKNQLSPIWTKILIWVLPMKDCAYMSLMNSTLYQNTLKPESFIIHFNKGSSK